MPSISEGFKYNTVILILDRDESRNYRIHQDGVGRCGRNHSGIHNLVVSTQFHLRMMRIIHAYYVISRIVRALRAREF